MSWKIADLERDLLIGSTLVEGSTLTEKQAVEALNGRTLQGHPISEVRELINYRTAVVWLMEQLNATPYLSSDLIQEFHARLFAGFVGEHGRWKAHANYTYSSGGQRHDYTAPPKVASEIAVWIESFNQKAPPETLETAARLYYEFQQIHPFEDGNGRVGRILIAYWLHWKASMNFTFRLADKIPHLKALEAANQGDLKPLIQFFKKRASKS